MSHPHPDDSELVHRCLAGDANAWQDLVDRYRRGLIDLARRILPASDAEDVVASVFSDLWKRRKLTRYEGRSTLATWLGAVAINAALNARRSEAARTGAHDDAAGSSPAVPGAGEPPDALRAVLHDAVAALPAESRMLVLLYYEQDLSLDQIGRLLGTSKATLSRALKQARSQIRASADRRARERWGTSLETLRDGVDLTELELDLRAACAPRSNETRGRVSKVRPIS